MRSVVAASAACFFAATAAWAECPGHPNAIGTARTIVLDPAAHSRIGSMQYRETLPLEDREVVLTFDDGPLSPYSNRILDTLAAECAKATFFMVGRQARAFPDLVRRAHGAGHTIATHTENHPFRFDRMTIGRASEEVEDGMASTAAALGEDNGVAPFFRIPGLRRSAESERYLAARGVAVWSADVVADDWRHISAKQVVQRALDRLERKGKGVLLLHDIQPATALALPNLLRELKTRGYRIVHVIPADRPQMIVEPRVLPPAFKGAWPRIVETARAPAPELPVASPQSFGWPGPFRATSLVPTKRVWFKLTRRSGYQSVEIVEANWPAVLPVHPAEASVALPAPSLQSFGMPHPYGPYIALPLGEDAPPTSTAANRADGPAPPSTALP